MRKQDRRKKTAQKQRTGLKCAIQQDPKTRAEFRRLRILGEEIAAILLDHEATLQQRSVEAEAPSPLPDR